MSTLRSPAARKMGAWCAAPALDFLPSAPPYAAATVSPGLTWRDEFHRENAPTASTAPAAALYAAKGAEQARPLPAANGLPVSVAVGDPTMNHQFPLHLSHT